ERFDGDDVFDPAIGIEKINSVQFALISGRNRDAVLGDLFDLDQMLFQDFDGDFLVFWLRLKQYERPNVVFLVVVRGLGKRRARRHRTVDRRLPIIVLRKHDRQLDHLLLLQFLRGYIVQDVGYIFRRRGELDVGAGIDARLQFAREARYGVMGFVHDHQRPVEMHQVREREFDFSLELSFLCAFEIGRVCRNAGEVRLQVFVVGIDLAPFGVLDTKRLDRANDEAKIAANVLRPDLRKVGYIEYAHLSPEEFVKRLPVRMTRILQRLDGLQPDRVGRHEPEHKRIVFLDQGIAG